MLVTKISGLFFKNGLVIFNLWAKFLSSMEIWVSLLQLWIILFVTFSLISFLKSLLMSKDNKGDSTFLIVSITSCLEIFCESLIVFVRWYFLVNRESNFFLCFSLHFCIMELNFKFERSKNLLIHGEKNLAFRAWKFLLVKHGRTPAHIAWFSCFGFYNSCYQRTVCIAKIFQGSCAQIVSCTCYHSAKVVRKIRCTRL